MVCVVRPQWNQCNGPNGTNGHHSEIDGHGEDVGVEVC
jgi:hypothetical protein